MGEVNQKECTSRSCYPVLLFCALSRQIHVISNSMNTTLLHVVSSSLHTCTCTVLYSVHMYIHIHVHVYVYMTYSLTQCLHVYMYNDYLLNSSYLGTSVFCFFLQFFCFRKTASGNIFYWSKSIWRYPLWTVKKVSTMCYNLVDSLNFMYKYTSTYMYYAYMYLCKSRW